MILSFNNEMFILNIIMPFFDIDRIRVEDMCHEVIINSTLINELSLYDMWYVSQI